MLSTQRLSLLHKPRYLCVRGTHPSDAKDGEPRCVDDASEIKSPDRCPLGVISPSTSSTRDGH